MATVKRFEELYVWQRAEAQCDALFRIMESERFQGHDALKDQMDRSSASVMDNIAEGFDRYTRADFRHFLIMARGSNAEFRSQLYRAEKRRVIDRETFVKLKNDCEQLGVMLHHLIEHISASEYRNKPSSVTDRNSTGDISEPHFSYVLHSDQSPMDLSDEFIAAFTVPTSNP